ncbi:MAG: glycerate kinase [Bacillota bacterium]|nr:glycerate kinase [Bacillota bacterium]
MKVVVAPNSFKGSLDAVRVAAAMKRGILGVDPRVAVVEVPMADGGEGTVEAVTGATGGTIRAVQVTGPTGTPVEARYGILGDKRTAVMEMAAAAGLPLVPEHLRDPLVTTTYGVGEMIADAVRQGIRRIVIGIGGSATNDGGAGMAQALGARLLDSTGQPLGPGGAELLRLERVSLDCMPPEIRELEVTVACDVDNPLYGPRGAAAIYGPQKGATPEKVEILDRALRRFAEVVEHDLHIDVASVPGAGAAGGLGAGLMVFLRAELRSGTELVSDVVRLAEKAQGASLVITGEGKMDRQTLMGKVPQGVAGISRRLGVPVVAIVGSYVGPLDEIHAAGIEAVFPALAGPVSLREAMGAAAENIEATTAQVFRLFCMAREQRRGMIE